MKMKYTTRDISELKEWDKNPRSITETAFKRLKRQIKKLGQYKPLIITEKNIVIGGNMRLKAYRELGIKKIWVSVVNAKNKDEMMEYALSDNDRAGFYDTDLLANMIHEYNIDLKDFAVDIDKPISLETMLKSFNPTDEVDRLDKLDEKEKVTCPECGHEFEP